MLDPKMEQQLNQQINEELYSSYLYLAMSGHCRAASLNGFAHWLRLQSEEERGHAMKICDYVNDQGGRVVLQAIKQPKGEYQSYVEVFEEVLAHERHITKLFDGLVGLAGQLNDHATHAFLQWFVSEQVEEEATVAELLDKLKMVGDDGPGLLALDRELHARTSSE